MDSNIDKLNLVAPLMAGRQISVCYEDEVGRTIGSGMFHSLEIDDVYPESEPTVYFRMTGVTWKRHPGFPGDDHYDYYSPEWENEVGDDEIDFPIARLELIEMKWGTHEGYFAVWFHMTDDEPSCELLFVMS